MIRAARRYRIYGFTAVSYGSRYRTVEGLNAPFNGRTQYGRGPYTIWPWAVFSRQKRPFRAVYGRKTHMPQSPPL